MTKGYQNPTDCFSFDLPLPCFPHPVITLKICTAGAEQEEYSISNTIKDGMKKQPFLLAMQSKGIVHPDQETPSFHRRFNCLLHKGVEHSTFPVSKVGEVQLSYRVQKKENRRQNEKRKKIQGYRTSDSYFAHRIQKQGALSGVSLLV